MEKDCPLTVGDLVPRMITGLLASGDLDASPKTLANFYLLILIDLLANELLVMEVSAP